MRLRSFTGVLMVCVGVTYLQGQDKPATGSETGKKGPLMVLSEVENLKLENLKLKKDLLDTQIKLAYAQLQAELNTTLAKITLDHGSPKGVTFNQQTWQFTAEEK